MARLPGTPPAGPAALHRGAARSVPLIVPLLVAIVAATGCSAKPARAKAKRGSVAARAREEKPLLEPTNVTTDAADRAAASPDPGPAEPGGNAAPPASTAVAETASADATPAPPEPEPAIPEDAAPLPSLGTSAPDRPRPRSPLVDPDTAIPLDGGRVQVSSPLGWTRSPRSQNYLVRYQPGPRKTSPSIVVTAEPAPGGLATVTTKNQADLVAAVTAKLAVDFPAGGPVKVIRKPQAVTLGEHAGVAWAVPGSAKVDGLTEAIDRFAWGVVLDGRLYVVEARAPRGKLDDDAKARAKAVASALVRPAGAPDGSSGTAPAE